MPHCGEAFTVDESGYAAILNQVRDQEFQREVDARVSLAEKSREQEVALAVTKAEEALRAQIAERDGQIAAQAERFKAQAKDFQLAAQNEKSELEKQVESLRAQLSSKDGEAEVARKLAVSDAVAAETERLRAVERERDELAQKLESERAQASMSTQIAVQRAEAAAKDAQVAVERERDDLRGKVERARDELEAQKTRAEAELARARAEAQAQLAEKLAGEGRAHRRPRARDRAHPGHEGAAFPRRCSASRLEQHCEIEFNRLRPTAFPRAYFEKDNEVVEGTKGDFVFRDFDEEGNEIVSIMFEMKNEADDSTHRKDQRVALQEARTPIAARRAASTPCSCRCSSRTTSCTPPASRTCPIASRRCTSSARSSSSRIITLLRNAALSSHGVPAASWRSCASRTSTSRTSRTHWPISRTSSGATTASPADKFRKAIEEIDKSIDHLQKMKDNLLGSENQLRSGQRRRPRI